MRTGRKNRVHVITMGCAKNVVDSEKLMAQLELNGLEITPTIEGADIAVINTCGFIDAAKEESIDMIIEQVTRKGMGRLRKVYAMGCLTERYRRDLEREIPEVDRFFGSHEIERVVHALGAEYKHDLLGERRLTTPRHFAYLKISEGCDNPCAFCAIPLMRGRHVSRPAEEVLAEARLLVRRGVRELIVIGQDTTYYGVDRRGTRQIAGLLRSMTEVEGVEWVRLMYTFPSGFPLDLLEEIAGNPRVCKYVDMPVQHVSDRVLKSMRRGISRRALMNLIETIRGRVPDIALRTTLIVGYPEETEREFEELARFVEEVRFDRLGVFTYSREEGTTAFPLGDPVPPAEKERRRARILELQQEISEERNAALIGTRQKVLLDRTEGELFVGRTERDAPEIDNEVFVTSATPLEIGNFYQIAIDSASEYDLYGKACS